MRAAKMGIRIHKMIKMAIWAGEEGGASSLESDVELLELSFWDK